MSLSEWFFGPKSATIDGEHYSSKDYDIEKKTVPGEGPTNSGYSHKIPHTVTTVYCKETGRVVKRGEEKQ